MTDEQINAAIAEACGWTCPSCDDPACSSALRPNYCNDLNAMHEAEEFLSGNLWIGYVNELANIEGNLFGIRATARQRAEAFLRTLGKWDHIGDTTEMMKEVQK